MDSSESIIQRISIVSGKPITEINSLINAKKEKFSGLLTDSGAAFMVAKELNVTLNENEEKTRENNIKINNLTEGQMGVNLTAIVEHVFTPKKFEKNNKKGILCNVLLKDETGEIRLTLWHEDVKKFFKQGIQRGDKISLTNCAVTKFNEKMQLSVFGNGKIELVEEGKSEKKKKLNELTENMVDVDALVKITRIYPMREFKTNNKQGKVITFIATDETKTIRCNAWNELTEVIQRTPLNSVVLIEGAYTKKGLQETELHLGWQSRILFYPRKNKEYETIQNINKIERKKLNELKPSEEIETRAIIVELIKGKMNYLACPKCGKKVETTEQGYVCPNCRVIENAKPRAIASILVDDGFACLRCSLFGLQAEQLLKTSAKKISEYNEEELQEFIKTKKQELIGKEIILQAKTKTNQYNETELTCITITKPHINQEIQNTIKKIEQ